VPVAKDLAADIDNAKLRVTFLDLEVVEMINRINIMEIELGLPIEDLAKGIIANLATLVNIYIVFCFKILLFKICID
jgi:hypothetical protein